ncbi:MAG: DUF4424 domain-containing protein [Parvibaculaceae bacterium]|nr:DUF4424 domain-containing protein [Parvibaculaceae bacterium]
MQGQRHYRFGGAMLLFLTLLVGLSISSHPTKAGDAFSGIAAGGLEVSNTRDISVQRQILIINPGIITSEYVLRNRSKKSIDAVMSFRAPAYPVGQAFDPKGATDLGPVPRLNYFDFSAQVGHEIIHLKHEGRAYIFDPIVGDRREITKMLERAAIPLLVERGAIQTAIDHLPALKRRALISAGALKIIEGAAVPTWELETKFYWDQPFEPGETLKVNFEYHPINANGIFSLDDLDEERYCLTDWGRKRVEQLAAEKVQSGRPLFFPGLTYKLRHPTKGQGPIAEFNLKIVPGEGNQVLSFCQYPLRYIDEDTLGYVRKDFTPHGDIDLLFVY